MQQNKLPHITQYSIATFARPVNFQCTEDETWSLVPPRRYIMTAKQLTSLSDHIEAISDFEGSAYHTRLMAGKNITGAKILVERNRERGIGDLLFLTGVFNYLHHVSGGNIKIFPYVYSDRGQVLRHHPCLHLGTALCGPICYDDLPLYDYHWFIPSVTECDEERDQLNVYDSLYKQLGFAPADIDPRFKRPSMHLVPDDLRHLDQFFYMVWMQRSVDLRRVPYYLVAPFSNASLRSMNYSTWIDIIKGLAARRPVLVTGLMTGNMPFTDMSAGEFNSQLNRLGPNVINALDATRNVRVLTGLISKAVAVVCVDSGPLYIAQAVRTPAVSIWGTHDPRVRIGYDPDYLDLAVFQHEACHAAPCYAYSAFPTHKCPRGDNQSVCEVMLAVDPATIIEKIEMIESSNNVLGTFSPKAPSP